MSIKERWQRLVSRKSLSSGLSTSSSSSSTNFSDRSACGDTTPYSTGVSTPTHPTLTQVPTPITIPSPVTTTSKPSPQSSSFQSNFLSKTLTWRSSHGGERKEKKRSSASKGKDASTAAAARRRIHPSERPLTEANLRQQEMLAQFKWEFGRSTGRRNSLGGWSVNSGISPCQSRRASYSALPPDQ
ncbi:hypothetical protein GE09DRAFT_1221238 [Coniochaeta sp. 2T2.1]|nr:hypothetical protein GE09DRAFT_1221238 [Coniochaeta sp. 2T2.1]